MTKPSEASGRIEALRISLGMTQTEFAEALGVSQSRISEWGAGSVTPSGEAWIKLAALAAKCDRPEALFFWARLGIQPEALLSVADMLLKDRVCDGKPLEDEGKIVLVPPFAEGPWKIQQSYPALKVDAKKVPNKASTYYLIAQPPSAWDPGKRGFAPGETIVFDAQGAFAQDFNRFRGNEVIVNFEKAKGAKPDWPEGLFVGRAEVHPEGAVRHMVLGPLDLAPYNWRREETVTLESFRPEHYMDASLRDHRPHPDHLQSLHDEWNRAYRVAESDAISQLRFPQGCQLLGRVRARFSAEPSDVWRRKW